MNSSTEGIRALLDGLAQVLVGFFTNVFRSIIGRRIDYDALLAVSVAASIVVVAVVVIPLIFLLRSYAFRRLEKAKDSEDKERRRRYAFWEAALPPLGWFMWILGAYIILSPLWWILGAREIALRGAVNKLFDYLILAVIFVFIFRSIRVIEEQVRVWGERTPGEMNDLLADLAGRSLRILFPVVALILVLPLLGLPEKYDTIIAKGSGFLIIGTISWILIHGVRFLEKAIMSRFDISAKDNLQARKVYTQVSVLRKTLIFIVIVFTAASMLMMFEEVRRLGTSILASAGVIGLIVGFAAQKTIANLFAGIQIAITQPIRLDDVVIVENEWGRIEEITLTYVVVRIWDLRRLVVPINYFIDNPFQNWTRVSADILGAVYLYTDYRLPIDSVREEFKRLCKESEFWDGKVCVLAVTNATERAMEVRALASAADASLAWNLRCELREKLITFIQANYPECLPKTRALIEKADAEKK